MKPGGGGNTAMVERYGRADAEERAATAAGFYPADDPSGAHWRAVLAHIQRSL